MFCNCRSFFLWTMKSRARNISILKFSLHHSHKKRISKFQKKILLSTWLFLYITWFAPLWKISRGHIIMVPDKTPQISKKYILEKNPATKVLGIYFNNNLKKEFIFMYNIIIRYVPYLWSRIFSILLKQL